VDEIPFVRLRDNPLLQQIIRGGCHASWRRWYRAPWLGSILLGLAILIICLSVAQTHSEDRRDFAIVMMSLIIFALTSSVSTLAVISSVSNGMGRLWKRSRVFDLLMTPMSGWEITSAQILGALLPWALWVAMVAVLCGLGLVVYQGRLDHPREIGWLWGNLGGATLATYLQMLGYTIGQSVWSAAVTMSVATRRRSVSAIQFEAGLWLILVTPLLIGSVGWLGYEVAERWGDLIPELVSEPVWRALLVWMPWVFAISVWVIKIGLSVWLLRGAARHFHTRMARQLERSVSAGP
jgi:hypothetical protein